MGRARDRAGLRRGVLTADGYSDEQAAALYDVINPWGPSDDFYLELVMQAGSVLDVGCGTGTLLHRARLAGHGGRLCGLDPDRAMLGRARRHADVEWAAGRCGSTTRSSRSPATSSP
jgi:SAM-dependent methyltransferase